MRNILVFGHSGQLAHCLRQAGGKKGFTIQTFGSGEFNLITQQVDIIDFILSRSDCEAVINASAWTNVDAAEFEAAEQAWQINAVAPALMAKACQKRHIPFIHVSTESVFSGQKSGAYQPHDPVRPVNFYGLSKLAGEQAIMEIQGHNLIVRTSWLFSRVGHNFVKSIFKLAKTKPVLQVVNDQTGLPTFAPDLTEALLAAARFLLDTLPTRQTQILHFAGGGTPVSRYEYAREIIKLGKLKCSIQPISSQQFAAPAPRPANAVLDSAAFHAMLGTRPKDWRDGLVQVIGDLKDE